MFIEKSLPLFICIFCIYVFFVTVMVAPMQPLSLEILEWSVKKELEGMRKDAVVAKFPALYLFGWKDWEIYDKFPYPVMICDQ